ncbi:MAG: hypothetical protein JW947_09955 [Sedimentisphaerales bacterium]|nr:hypothetical protein [Sedimentisphaerales bacterium]
MTRRKFIQELLKAGAAVIVGVSWLAKKASPRRFVRAFRIKKYPGAVKPLRNVHEQGKWSG